MQAKKTKIKNLLFINFHVWLLFFVLLLSSGEVEAGASQDKHEGAIPVLPSLEESKMNAEEEARICSLDSVVCPVREEHSVGGVPPSSTRISPSSRAGKMTISFYDELSSCHYPAKGGCLTASGKIAKYGMVATNLYPFGTKIKIEGLGVFVVEDRISKRYNNRIDVWIGYGQEANQQAKKLGIKNLKIEIL